MYLEINQTVLEDNDKRLSEDVFRKAAELTAEVLNVERDVVISVVFVGEKEMRALNKKHRGKNKVTDVLSFTYINRDALETNQEEQPTVGEVVLSYEQAKRQAKEVGHDVDDELVFLLVHGLLHVFGYDHKAPEERKAMFDLQDRVLKRMDINPQLSA